MPEPRGKKRSARSRDRSEVYGREAGPRRNRRERERDQARKPRRWPMVLMAVIAFVLLVATLLAAMKGFWIQRVTVHGTYRIDPEAVVAELSDMPGRHMVEGLGFLPGDLFRLRYPGRQAHLRDRFPEIATLSVRFVYPSEVRVDIEEKIELLSVRVSGGYALLDREGFVISVDEDRPDSLPCLIGNGLPATARPGDQLDLETHTILDQAIRLNARLIRLDQDQPDEPVFPLIHEVEIKEGGRVVLYLECLEGGRVRAELVAGRTLTDRLHLLRDLIYHHDILNRGSGELDMTGEKAVFRPDAG